MAPPCTTETLEVSTVTPPYSGLPKSFSLPLTFFDIRLLKFPLAQRIFFYKLAGSTPDNFFHIVILPRLKHSLSQTLFHFLPLASHVEWPPNSPVPIILYTPNEGVSLTVAVSNADLDHLTNNEPRDAVDSHPYVPELYVSENKTDVIAIQITLFPCKGFSIGYTFNHAVLDGRSINMFMKSWSHICKLMGNEKQPRHDYLLPEELTPYFDRSVVKDPSGLQESFLNQWKVVTEVDWNKNPRNLKPLPRLGLPREFIRATFELNGEDINKLKKMVLSQLNDPMIRLSSFVVTTAYVLVCMVKARREDYDKEVVFVFPVDYRDRLDPPLPLNYLGNCIFPHALYANAKDFMDENGVAFAARKIGTITTELNERLFEDWQGYITNVFKRRKQGAQVISVAGSPRFSAYETDFGWGNPKKVEVTSIDKIGAISLDDRKKEHGGIEIGLALIRHEMEEFCALFVDGLKDL